MSTLVMVLGTIGGYLVVGALYARSQAVACHARAVREWKRGYNAKHDEKFVRESMLGQQIWRALAWPWAIVYDAFAGGLAAWLRAPVEGEES